MSSDVESSFHDNAGSDSDDYIPGPAKKATKAAPSAAKKAATAPKKAPAAKKASASAAASTSKAPLKKRKSNEGEGGDADGDHSMSLIEAVEGKGAEKKTTNGAADAANGKSASETYQKVSGAL